MIIRRNTERAREVALSWERCSFFFFSFPLSPCASLWRNHLLFFIRCLVYGYAENRPTNDDATLINAARALLFPARSLFTFSLLFALAAFALSSISHFHTFFVDVTWWIRSVFFGAFDTEWKKRFLSFVCQPWRIINECFPFIRTFPEP